MKVQDGTVLRESMKDSAKVCSQRSACTTCCKTFLLRNFHGIQQKVMKWMNNLEKFGSDNLTLRKRASNHSMFFNTISLRKGFLRVGVSQLCMILYDFSCCKDKNCCRVESCCRTCLTNHMESISRHQLFIASGVDTHTHVTDKINFQKPGAHRPVATTHLV